MSNARMVEVGGRMCLGCSASTFVYHGELVFWDMRHPEQTVVVSLEHERYKKLIVEVADPHATVALLNSARTS